MNLDDQLESMEATGQTEAEEIDEATEIQDVEDDVDETLGPNAEESDLEHAYASFETDNEADYNGYEPFEVEESEADEMVSDDLHSEGYHVETAHDLEEEVIEMEIEEGDIYAYLVDEDDNEVGFILIDENGDKQQYYYVDMDEYELVDEGADEGVRVKRAEDGDEFDLGITREGVAEATAGMNDIYREGVAVASELKQTVDEISESMSFLRKR